MPRRQPTMTTTVQPPAISGVTVTVERADGSTVVYQLDPNKGAVGISTDVGFHNPYSPDGFDVLEDKRDPFGWASDRYEPTHMRYACVFPIGETGLAVERRWAGDAAVARIEELEAQLADMRRTLIDAAATLGS